MNNFRFKRRKKIRNKLFNLDETSVRFLEFKRLQRRSERTIKTYESTLRRFNTYCKEHGFNGNEYEAFESYMKYLTLEKTKWDDHPTSNSDKIGISSRSVNNVISVLSVFFNWAKTHNLTDDNPTEKFGRQTENNSNFEIFTDSEIQLLLNTPNRRTYTGFRDYIMMLVLIDTGIRLRELTSLKRGNFDLRRRQIIIDADITKSRKERTIPISRTTTEALQQLFDFIGIEDVDAAEFVFLTQFGDQFSGDNFAKNLKNYERRSEKAFKARVSPHTFRHYFAVKFLRNGGDPFALMKILGHTDISMTQRYVRYTETDLQEIHDKASPVESIAINKRVIRGKIKFR